MKRLLKPAVALVAALGLLTLLANPSAASSGAITGGTLTVSLTPPLAITLGGTGTCAASTITALDNSTGTLGSTAVAGTISIGITQGAFVYSGANYVFAGTLSGTYSSTHNAGSTYNVTVHLTMTNGTIRDALTTDPCVSNTTVTAKCPAIGIASFTLTGTASLTAVHPGPVGTVHLAGSRAVTAFCTAPFSALNGSTATVASLTAVLT